MLYIVFHIYTIGSPVSNCEINLEIIKLIYTLMYLCFSHGMVNPINYMEGVHIDFLNTLDVTPFNNEVDYTNYICRLGALKKKVCQF